MPKLKPCVIAATVATVLSTPLLAENVKAIDVTVELHGMETSEAARHWTSIEMDLEAAIAARTSDHLGEEGSEIHVEIIEMVLPTGPDASEAKLVGIVDIRTEDTPRKDLRMTARIDATNAPHASYLALVDAFADHVAARVN